MLIVVLIGILALATVVVAGLLYHRAPTRTTCPECDEPTTAVRPPGPLGRAPGITWRWCSACGWQGVGRNGPEWQPGRKVAHDSGFHWGDERLPEDFGFRWRREPDRGSEKAPPHHPSGFRFGTEQAPTAREENGNARGSAAHPSGFQWSDDAAETDPEPEGFAWREPDPPPPPEAGFRWGDEPEDRPPSEGRR